MADFPIKNALLQGEINGAPTGGELDISSVTLKNGLTFELSDGDIDAIGIAGGFGYLGAAFYVTTAGSFSYSVGIDGKITTLSTIELGDLSDTTLSRASAGRLAVEGVNVVTVSSTDTLTNKTISNSTNTITFPNSVTLSGDNNTASSHAKWATHQGTLITRNSMAWEQLASMGSIRRLAIHGGNFTSGAGGTGSLASYGGVTLITAATSGSYIALDFADAINDATGFGGAGHKFNRVQSYSATFTVSNTSNTAFRFHVGAIAASVPALSDANAAAQQAFGWEIYTDSVMKVRLWAHNGSTYSVSSGVAFGSSSTINHLIIESDGAGNLSLYGAAGSPPARPSSTALVTLANAPMTNTLSARTIRFSHVGSTSASTVANSRVYSVTAYIE